MLILYTEKTSNSGNSFSLCKIVFVLQKRKSDLTFISIGLRLTKRVNTSRFSNCLTNSTNCRIG